MVLRNGEPGDEGEGDADGERLVEIGAERICDQVDVTAGGVGAEQRLTVQTMRPDWRRSRVGGMALGGGGIKFTIGRFNSQRAGDKALPPASIQHFLLRR